MVNFFCFSILYIKCSKCNNKNLYQFLKILYSLENEVFD